MDSNKNSDNMNVNGNTPSEKSEVPNTDKNSLLDKLTVSPASDGDAPEREDSTKMAAGKNNPNDTDEVIKIFQKKHAANAANAAHAAHAANVAADQHHDTAYSHVKDNHVIENRAKEPQTPVVKKAPEPTRVNIDAVKPVAHSIPKQQQEPGGHENNKPVPSETASQPKANGSHDAPKKNVGVSLDDFNRASVSPSVTSKKTRSGHKFSGKKSENNGADGDVKVAFLGSTTFGIIKIVLYIAVVALCCYFLSTTVINVANDIFAFVKNGTAEELEEQNVTIVIPEGATTEDVAQILYEAGVIKYPWVFEVYANFRIERRSYLTGEYLTGEVTVNPMNNYDELIDIVSDYERTQPTGTVRITIPEGLTVNETIDLLVENGVGDKEDYLEALQSFEYEYRFAKELTPDKLSEYRFDTDYSYRLEGYLFPDTYDFYLNENPISALDKFLVNFDRKFEDEFYERCDELGMTVDEIITLASMIEKEGNNAEDYYYISSVFHNRLNNSADFPYLNSDATVQYALGERTGMYGLDTSIDHPYNTYKNKGLPPGPICNPGTEAIYAALYPYETSYYYFYTKKNGETVYSRTYQEHQNYINADKNS